MSSDVLKEWVRGMDLNNGIKAKHCQTCRFSKSIDDNWSGYVKCLKCKVKLCSQCECSCNICILMRVYKCGPTYR